MVHLCNPSVQESEAKDQDFTVRTLAQKIVDVALCDREVITINLTSFPTRDNYLLYSCPDIFLFLKITCLKNAFVDGYAPPCLHP